MGFNYIQTTTLDLELKASLSDIARPFQNTKQNKYINNNNKIKEKTEDSPFPGPTYSATFFSCAPRGSSGRTSTNNKPKHMLIPPTVHFFLLGLNGNFELTNDS